ncbi:hypothetical protein C3L33_23454, partial [Rhododendron williamsianum]
VISDQVYNSNASVPVQDDGVEKSDQDFHIFQKRPKPFRLMKEASFVEDIVIIMWGTVVEAWATAKFGGNHDASSAEDELHTKSYTSLLDMLGKYVLKNVQQVPISYNPMSYNILSSLRTVLFSSLPKGGVDNSLMYNGVACTGRQIHAMRRWTHRMASCPELPPPLEDIFKSLFWFGNYANSNGQLTMWKEETTNWFGSYAMRFERTPDLSGCYAKVSGSGQGCGAAAGQKRT